MSSKPKRSDSVDLPRGTAVGAYRVERHLGSGGMAEVYYAIHEGLERPAALKILRPSLATDATHLQRFMQEARAAASLVHPNIVQVYDVGQSGEWRYIAQEYVPGSNLRNYLALPLAPTAAHALAGPSDPTPAATARGAVLPANGSEAGAEASAAPCDRQLPIPETLSILLQVLAALNKSASSGIVHRDIKPENIMLTQDGDVKVADFGLARILYGDDPQLTRAGTTLGTPMYMSPEQIQEGVVDIRSDLYSLGVTLYHMLTGRPPFTGETPLALAMQHVQASVPDMCQFRSGLPSPLVELVERLLHKQPIDRFESPKDVLDFLRQHRSGALAAVWPDQTVPLPGASGSGPLQATLQLQLKLRKKQRARWERIFRGAAAVVAVLAAFIAGNFLTYSPGNQILSSEGMPVPGIPKRSSAEEQYRWALVDNKANPIEKWQAVEQYFPPGDRNGINRLYAGLAKLQLARAYQASGEMQAATAQLQNLLGYDGSDGMLRLLRAHAWLQKASLEREQDREAEVIKAVREAKAIRNGLDFNEKDREQLDNAVRTLADPEVQQLWFEG
jgi:eukaryotic-like serine/threonine-protein kinase